MNVRGFGPVKEAAMREAGPQRETLLAALTRKPVALAAE